MQGAARAAVKRHDEMVYLAWHTAAFNAATKSKKGLPSLSSLKGEKVKAKPQSNDEMLAVLQSMGAPGMNIRRVN